MVPFIILSLLFAAGSFAVSRWAGKRASQAEAVDQATSLPLAQLTEDTASVARELGAGSFRQEVKIRGRIVCDSPLTAELSHTPCVSYRFTVTREYEEVLWEKDAQGNSTQRRNRKSEVVATNQVSVPFWLDDGTARVLVHPEGARLEMAKSHASFQQALTPGVRTGVGSFVLQVEGTPGGTLGYRYEEHCLAVGQEVTVVAEAGDGGGSLALRRPEGGQAPFLISTRGILELSKGNRRAVAVLRGVSIGLAAVAVLIFVLGVVR